MTRAVIEGVRVRPLHAETNGSATLPADLPDDDIRGRLDEAVRRGWRAVGRRGLRGGVLLALDILAVALSMALAMAIVVPVSAGGPILIFEAISLAVLVQMMVLQPLVLQWVGSYRDGTDPVSLRRVPRGVWLAALLAGAQVAVAGPLEVGNPLPIFLLYALLAPFAIVGGRLVTRQVLRLAYRGGLGQRRVLVIGGAPGDVEARPVALSPDVRIVGRVFGQGPGSARAMTWLDDAVREAQADGILITSAVPPDHFDALVAGCFRMGLSVTVVPQTLQALDRTRVVVRQTPSGALMELAPQGLRLPRLSLKRAMDITLTLVGLLFIWPLLLLIAAGIKLESRGPVLFSQVRAGVGGRPFRMYKFRTMVANAEDLKGELQALNESGDPRLFKIRNDPRVTRIGRLLRRTSLDELPQLINVLRGDMSLVGPRPFFPGDLDSYDDHHFERLWVLPGITGLWQVNGRSDVVDFDEVVRMDADYIRNWSIGMDLSILYRTIPAALGRNGAY
jgi:exopolysaccharide biosynthesis polyprenyl glycosylphosphotransferase